MRQQSAFEYLRHGQTPFFRLPVAVSDKPDPAAYAGAHAVLLGVPFDAGTTYQPGARFAPYHVRRVSALVQTYHPVHRVDVFGTLRALDGGNVAFPPFAPPAMREHVEAEVGAIVAAGAIPFVLGGDHSVSLPAMRAVAREHGPLAIVHVDAHLDTSGPEVWGDAWHHGTPLRHAVENELCAKGQLHQIGVRAPWGGEDEGALAAGHGGSRFGMEEIARVGVAALCARVRDAIGDRPMYLTIDIDAIDPAFAPGTGTPVPGGLTSREVIELVRGLAGLRLCGMDLVEIAPGLDHADLTSHLGATLLYEALALAALRRAKSPRA
jgi:agmatinase